MNRTQWLLLSRAADDCCEQRVTGPILRELARLNLRCDHIDDGRGVNGVSPVLLTEERRFEGHAAIAAFLRHATREIARLEGRWPAPVVRTTPSIRSSRRNRAFAG